MKKLNLLSKAEMKKVMGGNPLWSASCVDPIYGNVGCFPSSNECAFQCEWPCQVNTGHVGC